MADPYTPPRPGTPDTVTPGLAGTPSGVAPGAPRGEYTRTNVNVESPAVKSGNGFATGLMVALVFIVVAILAYSFLGNRDDDGTALETTPDISIENNAAPAPAEDAVAPDAVAPDAATPDAAAPEAVAPDTATPDATTPDPVAPAPDATAPAAPANP